MKKRICFLKEGEELWANNDGFVEKKRKKKKRGKEKRKKEQKERMKKKKKKEDQNPKQRATVSMKDFLRANFLHLYL